MNKDNPIFGLHKIPDKALIRELRIELGKQNAYIIELQDKIKVLESEINIRETEERKNIRRETVFDEYREQIKLLNNLVKKLRKDNSYLITKLNTR